MRQACGWYIGSIDREWLFRFIDRIGRASILAAMREAAQ